MMRSGSVSKCTHLVLNLPAADDFLDILQYVSEFEPNSAPVVVIISDLYQKRQISTRVKELAATGKQVFIVPKPVKPFSFSTIFDPSSKRELSKDRNQDMAREINNNFKSMSKLVKEVLGNKGYRILLVEDDETNRDVCGRCSPLLFSDHANQADRSCSNTWTKSSSCQRLHAMGRSAQTWSCLRSPGTTL